MGIKKIILSINTYPEELGLDLNKEDDRFKWLIASILFAKRISFKIAIRTFKEFINRGLTTPNAILDAGWDGLVDALDAGGYVRYDFSTASNLLETVKMLKKQGGLKEIYRNSKDSKELEEKLMKLKGVGPTAVNIFLRELRSVWKKAKPKPSKIALDVADKIGLKDVEELEPRLVRIGIEYCKRKRCEECPVHLYCKKIQK